jgi:hypothetical protein
LTDRVLLFRRAGWRREGRLLVRQTSTARLAVYLTRQRFEVIECIGDPEQLIGWLHGATALILAAEGIDIDNPPEG